MARKKKSKKVSWLKLVLLFTFVPVTVWILAFFAWLYWDDIGKLVFNDSGRGRTLPPRSQKLERDGNSAARGKGPQERILDDDRKRLEEILKQRQ